MKFGVREIANCVFKAKSNMKIGSSLFRAGQPVLYIDTAKTSTLEGAATSVYATGGRGNTRLVTWEGEKTLTFTVEDALLSPIGFAILSGAGLFHPEKGTEGANAEVHVHATAHVPVKKVTNQYYIDLTDSLGENEVIDFTAPTFVMVTEEDGSITGDMITELIPVKSDVTAGGIKSDKAFQLQAAQASSYGTANVFVDFYMTKKASDVHEMQIDAEHFGGYFYVEADTLFRDQASGKDLPAILTLPNVKIQSNFSFSMAATGDPSTFTFTMDAMPGYTYFNKQQKVLCVIQVINELAQNKADLDSVMRHADDKVVDVNDSGEDISGDVYTPSKTPYEKKYIDSMSAANVSGMSTYSLDGN